LKKIKINWPVNTRLGKIKENLERFQKIKENKKELRKISEEK